MTGPTPAPAPTSTRAAPRARRRRWHRAVLPLAAVLALLIISSVAYLMEQPDPTDPAYLSPVSDADIGARRLADRIRGHGVVVQRHTGTADALAATRDGTATVLIPAPELSHREYLWRLPRLAAGTRVVLVGAGAEVLRGVPLPVTAGPQRWATAVRPPAPGQTTCTLPEISHAGPAAATRQRYRGVGEVATERHRCYDDGLLVLAWGGIELVLIGAHDPFRNDRIGEHGNAALATGLLTTRPRLVWLDLHAAEPPPVADRRPGTDSADAQAPPVDDGGSPGAGGRGRDGGRGVSGEARDRSPRVAGPGDDGDQPAIAPPWFWAVLAQLALAALLLALWRARRLGAPVAEPLPVTVPSAETVYGRGRLYRRARARGPALEILRAATLPRLTAALGLPADAAPAAVVAAAAARTGRPEHEVETVLYGPGPESDDDLVRMATELDVLARTVPAAPAGRGQEDE